MQGHIVLKPSTNSGVTISGTYGTALPTPDTDVVAAILNIETSDVRMRWDGTVPASDGVDGALLMKKDSVWEITGRDILVNMRFAPSTTDAFVVASYLKGG